TPEPAHPADPATSQAWVGSQAAASADTPVIGGVISTADAAPSGHHRQISPQRPSRRTSHPYRNLWHSVTSPRNSETRVIGKQVLRKRIVRCEQVPEDSTDDPEQQDARADEERRPAQQQAPPGRRGPARG